MLLTLISTLRMYLHLLIKDEKGQDLAEYGLLLVLIAIAVVAAVTALGGQLSSVFSAIKDSLGLPSSGS